MLTIPPQLADNLCAWHGADGDRWLAELPQRVGELAGRWRLDVGEPFAQVGAVSWVAPARTSQGEDAVLKVFLVGLENAQEGEALEHYAGRGAVRMLAREPGALLLERLRPGTALWDVEDDDAACRVVAGLLRQLWRPPTDPSVFRALGDDAAMWATHLERDYATAGAPFERSLLDEALRAAADLPDGQGEHVVLHQDLHGGNVLRWGGGWVAIDPKPVVGEREFDLASLIRDRRWAVTEEVVRRRLDLLAGELGLDRERMRRWSLLHALAWGLGDDGADAAMVACARWLAAM